MVVALNFLFHIELIYLIIMIIKELRPITWVDRHRMPGLFENSRTTSRAARNSGVNHLLDILLVNFYHIHPEAALVTKCLLDVQHISMAELHCVMHCTLERKVFLTGCRIGRLAIINTLLLLVLMLLASLISVLHLRASFDILNLDLQLSTARISFV